MRLNDQIDEYDIRSLSNISSTVSLLKRKCNLLNNVADTMSKNVRMVNQDFTSVNFIRSNEILTEFMKKLDEAEMEFDELLKSVDEFTAKIEHAWRPF